MIIKGAILDSAVLAIVMAVPPWVLWRAAGLKRRFTKRQHVATSQEKPAEVMTHHASIHQNPAAKYGELAPAASSAHPPGW